VVFELQHARVELPSSAGRSDRDDQRDQRQHEHVGRSDEAEQNGDGFHGTLSPMEARLSPGRGPRLRPRVVAAGFPEHVAKPSPSTHGFVVRTLAGVGFPVHRARCDDDG
jgi:hypothetical protein